MSEQMRIFLAHPKGWTDEQIDAARAGLSAAFPAHVVVAARDEWERVGKAVGGFKGWTQRIGGGTGLDGRPFFSVIAVPAGPIGKATAQIAELALQQGRFVLVEDDGAWKRGRLVRWTGQGFTDCAEIEV